jgi:hypothetical protein
MACAKIKKSWLAHPGTFGFQAVNLRALHLQAQGHHQQADGSCQPLSAEHIFRDYQFSTDNKIALPPQK